jgi:uncharacterized protein (DUF924 family)
MCPRTYDDFHQFWFGPIPDFESFNADRLTLWFGGARDAEIAAMFSAALSTVQDAMPDIAALSTQQQVGLVLLLDQVPRSIFRGEARCYAYDEMARGVVRAATVNGMDRFKLVERAFITICLAHSEHLDDQERASRHYRDDVAPFAPTGNRFYEGGRIQTAKYHDIIKRFGRFPHRNTTLGRKTTAVEAAFLAKTKMAPF